MKPTAYSGAMEHHSGTMRATITSSDPMSNSGVSADTLKAIPSPRAWYPRPKSIAGPVRRSRLKGGCSHDWLPHKGSALLESALLVPILLALLIGTTELGRVTYTYYMIQKVLAGLARSLGTQQGVNFCNSGDPIMQAAINNALTGTSDASGTPI